MLAVLNLGRVHSPKVRSLMLSSNVPIFTGNGPGSGGRIAVYLSEDLSFQGSLTALGGSFSGVSGSEYRYGAPGTVYVHSTVGSDITTELWVDNAARSYAYSYQCAYPVTIDVDQLTYLKLFRKACVIPSKVQ